MLTQKIFVASQSGAEIIVYLLIIMSILSVAFMIERWVVLRKIRKNSDRVKVRLREALQSNNLAELEDISRDRDTLEGRALSYGLRHAKQSGASGLQEVFNSFSIMERPNLEKYLNYLATVGANAPFIGLLGTVLGIMKAFNDLSITQGNAPVVMVGIAEALVSTAVGLLVAIPAVVAYNYFQKQVRAVMLNLDNVRELCMALALQKKN